MYDIFKNVINSKEYELKDILNKIDSFYIKSELTESQCIELKDLARQNAVPDHSYSTFDVQIQELYTLVYALQDAVKTLQNSTDPIVVEYPQWIQPTGAHNAYNIGDKITYIDGKKYKCLISGCVWGPDVYPTGWEEVVITSTVE